MGHGRTKAESFTIRGGSAALLLAAVGLAGPARADDKPACAAAYQKAQESIHASHLREARDLMSSCAKASCGPFVQQECVAAYTRLDTYDIPSIVPRATDESGAPRTDVQVTMDGEVITSSLDGRAVSVDPGLHEFSFSSNGETIRRKRKLMIAEGSTPA